MSIEVDYYVSIDFETYGAVTSENGFTQLGSCIMCAKTGCVVGKFNQYANQQGYTKDEACMERFWRKHPKTLARTEQKCAESPHTPHQVVELWYNWVMETLPNKNAMNISDNSEFDVGILRFFCKHDILTMYGSYRCFVDTNKFFQGMARRPYSFKDWSIDRAKEVVGELPPSPTEHDHDAVNDAISIAHNWAHIQLKLQNQTQ
jgi:hypothetical protein